MNPGIVGSIISSGYLDIDIRGYNLPIITGQTKSITTSGVLLRCSEIFNTFNKTTEANIVKYLNAHSKITQNSPKKQISELNDYHYIFLYVGYLISKPYGVEDTLKGLKEKISKDLIPFVDFIASAYDQDSNKEVFINNNKSLFDQKYDCFFALGDKRLSIKSSIALGVKAGTESSTFEDAVRRVMYCGVNDDVAMTIASIIAEKRSLSISDDINKKAKDISLSIPLLN